jgi:hypothetical protein
LRHILDADPFLYFDRSSILKEKERQLGGAAPEADDLAMATLETAWEHTEVRFHVIG